MSKKKILVIDDEELLTKTFTLLLDRSGYDVLVARNGEDARILAEEEKFDLIISDIRMPGTDGVKFATEVKSLKLINKDTPLIFVTGYADSGAEEAAKALNPIAYIHKPFDNKQVLDAIKKALGA